MWVGVFSRSGSMGFIRLICEIGPILNEPHSYVCCCAVRSERGRTVAVERIFPQLGSIGPPRSDLLSHDGVSEQVRRLTSRICATRHTWRRDGNVFA